MKKNAPILPIAIWLLLFSLWIVAQSPDSLLITASYQAQTINSVVQDIEAAHPIQFYFKEADLPKKSITAEFDATPLSEALTEVLRGTTMDFIIYRDYLFSSYV